MFNEAPKRIQFDESFYQETMSVNWHRSENTAILRIYLDCICHLEFSNNWKKLSKDIVALISKRRMYGFSPPPYDC